jgi:hypothetical protein
MGIGYWVLGIGKVTKVETIGVRLGLVTLVGIACLERASPPCRNHHHLTPFDLVFGDLQQ